MHFLTQYCLLFLLFLLLSDFNNYFSRIFERIGQFLVLSSISWSLTRSLRKFNYNSLSSYKKAVLVTGCDTGFGNALVKQLNSNGYRVYATVLNTNCAGAYDLLVSDRSEGKTKIIRMDVTNDEDIKSAFHEISNDLLKNGDELWAVVNNAGIMTLGPIDWGLFESYNHVFNVNTFGTVRVTRAFLSLIRKSKGRIVNLVSIAGRFTAPNMGIYSMSKHATISFSDALRRENEKLGVKVSTIEPHSYKTSMTSDDIIYNVFNKQWNESSNEVKEFYGEEFYHDLRDSKDKGNFMFPPSKNIDDVINSLIDAIQSPEPEISYVIIPKYFLLTRLFVSLAPYLPTQIHDIISKAYSVVKN